MGHQVSLFGRTHGFPRSASWCKCQPNSHALHAFQQFSGVNLQPLEVGTRSESEDSRWLAVERWSGLYEGLTPFLQQEKMRPTPGAFLCTAASPSRTGQI